MKKIKVAQIITRMIVGGAQENTLHTCQQLAKDPLYQVTLITGPSLGPEGDLLDSLEPNAGFEIVKLKHLRRGINPIRDLIAFFQLVRILRKNQFDLVHTHSSKAGILGRWAAWVARIPVRVHTIHGWGFHSYLNPLVQKFYIFLERWTAKITTRLIAVSSENIQKGLESKIGTQEKYLTIYSGISLSTFAQSQGPNSLRDNFSLPPSKLIVATIGRLVEQKNPLLFVNIASTLLQQNPNLFFVMIGDGPLRKKVEKEIESLNIGNAFLLPGLRRDVPKWISLIDIFVLSSRWEGLPRALLQVMAAGKPVVASQTDGILEVLKNESNGILIENEDPKKWSQAIQDLVDNPKKREGIGRCAKQSITDRFSDDKMVQDLKELFSKLLQ